MATATAPGQGGVGVVRLSGPQLLPLAAALLGARAGRLAPREALWARFMDGAGEAIDEGLVLWFPAPGSYTGEDTLELQGHGGPVVLRRVLARCLEAGAPYGLRLAQAGEFTRRAFLNGRIDLAQAEAVADLIEADSEAAARAAMRSLQGAFSRHVRVLAAGLDELRALVEATLDFPEEEIDFLRAADARGRLAQLRAQLTGTLERARQGARLRAGLQVALLGAPNTGKSSLLNALAGEEAAIVTEHAGTTRDRIERSIQVAGLAVHLIDTAGLRATTDPVEQLGIARSLEAARSADLVLELRDATAPGASALDDALRSELSAAGRAPVTVWNKCDIAAAPADASADAGTPAGAFAGPGSRASTALSAVGTGSPLAVSARTGAGLDTLRALLARHAQGMTGSGGEDTFLARERHVQALVQADGHLAGALEALDAGGAHLELAAEDLRLAGRALGEITGQTGTEDLLGLIFGRFCIGK